MAEWETLVFGSVSMFALLFLFAGYQSITGSAVDEYELFVVQDAAAPQPQQNYPPLPANVLVFAENATIGLSPPRESLLPDFMGFQVDRVPIPETSEYHFISLRKDTIHTFSGSAGYYPEDPGEFLQGFLCAYPYKFSAVPARCEPVALGHADGMIGFAQGYKPGEYIGHQAVGTDFGAFFILVNPDHGVIAASPIAYLRWTSN